VLHQGIASLFSRLPRSPVGDLSLGPRRTLCLPRSCSPFPCWASVAPSTSPALSFVSLSLSLLRTLRSINVPAQHWTRCLPSTLLPPLSFILLPPLQLRYPVPLTFSFSPTAVASSVFLARVFSYIAATALLALYILRLLGLRFEPSIPRFVPAASPLFNLPSHAHLSTQHPPSDSRPSTRQTAAPPLPTNPKRTSQLHHLPPLVIRCSSAVLHTLDSALQRVAGRRPSPRPS